MGNQMKKRFDTFLFGVLAAVLGAALGFFLFGLFIAEFNGVSFGRFLETLVNGTDYFHDKLVTVSILFDVILFFVMIRKEYYHFCKGILAVVILSVPVAVYLY